MALPPCDPCECIPGNIPDDKFKQDVVNVLCQTLTTLGYEFPEDACDPCACIQGNIPNDKFKQDVEILLCLILANIGGGGGGGSVTSFSFNDANGISGVVTNPTTTPDLTLTLGAITPTSVAASGTVTGSNLSGTNTGNQTITLTGNVTGSGTGSFAATIANDAVTFAKFQNITTARLLGRATAGSGDMEEITLGTGLSFTGTTLNASGAASAITDLTGDVTGTGPGSTATTIANDAVTFAKFQNITTARLLGRATAGSGDMEEITLGTNLSFTGTTLNAAGSSGTVTSVSVVTANGVSGSVATATTTPAITLTLGAITPSSVAAVGTVTGSNLSGTNTGDQTITLTGDVTGSGTGSFAATIANDAVTFAKIQNITTARLLGRATAGSGDMEEITLGTGLSYTGTTLNVSGAALAITALTGDVTATGPGSSAATIANDAVTFAKIQNITTARLLGRATAGSGDTEEITLGTGLSFTGTTLNASAIGVFKAIGAWRADEGQPPAAAFATMATRNATSPIPTLDFDQTTQEIVVFGGVVPNTYNGGNIVVNLYWTAVPTSGTGAWDVTFERILAGTTDIDGDNWATAQAIAAVTVPGTSGVVTIGTVTCTAGAAGTASLVAGDKFRMRVRRDVANDSAAGDLNLLDATAYEV